MNAEMEAHVLVEKLPVRNGRHIGLLTLNQPRSLNALNLAMVDLIHDTLKTWASDPHVVAVVLRGAGDRAFCAGGDVKSVYRSLTHPLPEHPPAAFFLREYAMDYALHTFPKAVIALGHGVIMGGGLGILMGASVRLVAERIKIAMPEIGIGLFPDVGAHYFLRVLPEELGHFMALTGLSLDSGDSLFAGIAHRCVPSEYFNDLLKALTDIEWQAERDADSAQVLSLIDRLGHTLTPKSEIEIQLDDINQAFVKGSAVELLDALKHHPFENPGLQAAQHAFREGSPLSALLIEHYWRFCEGQPLREVFKSDAMLAYHTASHGDFIEGVRARLIDRDQQAKWRYSNWHDIPDFDIQTFFENPWPAVHPLEVLFDDE